jgi:hypothetical protein
MLFRSPLPTVLILSTTFDLTVSLQSAVFNSCTNSTPLGEADLCILSAHGLDTFITMIIMMIT